MGGWIETIKRNRISRHTDEYDILGRTQHSSEGKSSLTNPLQFSEGVAKQVGNIKSADIIINLDFQKGVLTRSLASLFKET